MGGFRNVFACLVHDNQECVVDLVRNLRYLDPDSIVLLYNGGLDDRLLTGAFPFERHGAVVHPNPQPLQWGRLHDFALDCMRFAIDHLAFDAITIVDSDQLAARPGYSQALASFFADRPRLGLAGSSGDVQPPTTTIGPAAAAFREIELWRPFLSRFPDGVEKFAHWVFWPSTIFSAPAAHDLTRLFANDAQLAEIISRSQIWASEEVIFPTLVALLGYEVAKSPCSYQYVKHRVEYTRPEIETALDDAASFWIHPVQRRYNDPLRAHVRTHFGNYDRQSRLGARLASGLLAPAGGACAGLGAIVDRMRRIDGWLDDDEAELLVAATTRAVAELPPPHIIVEAGSYCGRATVVLGSVLRARGSTGQVFAIDAHDGVVGALDTGLQALTPTRERFERTIADAGLTRVVVPLARRPSEVAWVRPISLLLIDGLHDYPNVARDFHHFEEHLVPGGYVAFHDYADYFPGVKAFVNELVAGGGYEHVMRTRSLALVRKSAAAQPLVSKAATIVMIPHDDVDCACRRLSRDIVPSLEHYPDWSFELIVVDNSARRMDRLADAVAALPWPSRYVWHDGANLYYGPALNVAANLASHPVLVYVCANHGRMVDPGWIEDLVTPIWDDERVAMTGHPYPSQHPSELGFRDTGQYFHIQGGLLAARTDVIRRFPYDEGQYAHWGSDIWQSYQLMDAGFVLRPVPSIVSVWREKAPPGAWKYIHDHCER